LNNFTIIKVSKVFFLSALILLASGCSKHPDVEEGKHETYHERSYSTSELQKRYEHILKDRKKGKDIDATKRTLRKDTKQTFVGIDGYKKKLARLSAARRSSMKGNRRFGKNSLGKEGATQPRYVYSEGCVSNRASLSPEGSNKQDIDSINEELKKYY